MRKLIATLVSSLFTLSLFGQQHIFSLDHWKCLCKSDSIRSYFVLSLEKQNVDTIISILYDYDNGRMGEYTKHIIIWKEDGKTAIRILDGFDQIYRDTTYVLYDNYIFDYVTHTKFKTTGIEAGISQSHDLGYYIKIRLPGKRLAMNVRNYERLNIPANKKALNDSRVILANKINDLIAGF